MPVFKIVAVLTLFVFSSVFFASATSTMDGVSVIGVNSYIQGAQGNSISYSEILSNSNITSFCVDSDNTFFAAGTNNSNGTDTLYYFDSNGHLIWDFILTSTILQISLSSNGSYLAVSYGNALSLFSGIGQLLWTKVINGPVSGAYITTLSISENGTYIAAGSIGPQGEPYGAIYLYSDSGSMLWNYTNGTSSYLAIHTVQISNNNKYVVMAAGNGLANGGYLALFNMNGSIVWNIATPKVPLDAFFTNNSTYIVTPAFITFAAKGSNGLYFYGLNGTLIWQATFGLNAGPLPAATSNGDGYIGAGSNGNVSYFSSSGKEIWNRDIVSSQSVPILVSMTQGSNAIASAYDNTVDVLSSNGVEVYVYTFTQLVTDVQFFAAGNKLLVGTEDGLYLGTFAISNIHTTTYLLTFSESGLPNGTSWYVTLNGSTHSSTTDNISFSLANGTYPFAVATVSGYTPSPSSGSLLVSGSNFSENIAFTAISATSDTVIIYLMIVATAAFVVAISSIFFKKRS